MTEQHAQKDTGIHFGGPLQKMVIKNTDPNGMFGGIKKGNWWTDTGKPLKTN